MLSIDMYVLIPKSWGPNITSDIQVGNKPRFAVSFRQPSVLIVE